jgi:hypothetical protein
MEQVGNVFLICQSLAVCVVCFPTLRCMPIVTTDQVESVDEEGRKVEGVGYVLEADVLCQSFD